MQPINYKDFIITFSRLPIIEACYQSINNDATIYGIFEDDIHDEKLIPCVFSLYFCKSSGNP